MTVPALNTMGQLLRSPGEVTVRVYASPLRIPHVLLWLTVIVLVGGLYGMSVGSYVGGEQILFAGVKMPLFFLGTAVISFLLMHFSMLTVLGGISFSQTFELVLICIGVTNLVLLGWAPIQLLFSMSLPFPSYPSYLFLILLMVMSIATAGLAGVYYLYRGLSAMAFERGKIFRVMMMWIVIYHFVGGQVAWLLRPFVGSSGDVAGKFSIWHNMEGNIYDATFRSLMNLLKQSF